MTGLFQRRIAGYVAAVLGIAAVTSVCALLRSRVNEMTVALLMMVVVLFVATAWERMPALLASVLGMLCLNYFFLPPIYTFTIADPKNWMALTAFFITALTAGRLSAWAKEHAAQAEASRNQARLGSAYNRSLLEASLDPTMTIGSDGKISDVNAAAETITGRSREELIGTDFFEHFSEREKARSAYEEVLRGGVVRGYALNLRHRGGHSTSVLFDGSLYRDADGHVIGVAAAARPIATYVAAESPATRRDPLVVRHLSLLVRGASLFSIAVGAISIIGLAFGIAALKSVFPGEPVIKMNAAVCLVLLGLSLWCLRSEHRPPAELRLGQLAAGIAALAGLLSLAEYSFGWDFGLDQLLFREPAADAFFSSRPGLIAPITAFDFLLLGLGLLWLDRPISWKSKRYWLSQYVAGVTAVLSIVGLLDFLLRSHTSYTHIALQTAASLLLLSLGVLCTHHDRGLAALLASSTAGGALLRRLLPGAIIIPTAIGALSWNILSAGKYSEWGAICLVIVAMITLLSAFSIWNAYIVDRGAEERERSEAILQRRQGELREAQRLAQLGSWWWDPKADTVTWSAGLSHLTRRDPMLPPPSYKEHLRFYAPQSSEKLGRAVESAITTGIPFELDLEMVRADGVHRQVMERGEVEHDLKGRVVLVRGTVQDITERKRAEKELHRINRAHRALSTCNETLVRATDESGLLQEMCRTIVREAGYRCCWVGHAELDNGKAVTPLAQAGLDNEFLEALKITWADSGRGQGPTGTCIRTGKPQLAMNIATDPNMIPWRAATMKRGLASCIAVPLIVASKIFGALTIYSSEAGAFVPEEVKLLTELAGDLGYGVTSLRTAAQRLNAEEEIRKLNAELEDRVTTRTAELQAAKVQIEQAREREIEIGFKIQQTLLLDQPPSDVPGLRVAALTIPSQRIDGDFYIFLRHSDECLDVIVGDVMGKGIPAALLGAATKSHFLRALSDLMNLAPKGELPEPKEIVMLAHAELARHLIELDSFVTLVYARFDGKRRALTLVDCGHTGILHRVAKTGKCEAYHNGNLPLGVREGEIYDQCSIPFEAGDLMLFYSDGITEARNTAKELFGADRLQEYVQVNGALDPATLVEGIRKAVSIFSGSTQLADDLTAVAVRVEDMQAPTARAEIEISSDLRQLRQVREFIRCFCATLPKVLDEASAGALELAVNEAASNIMKHAYHGRADQWIHLEAEAFPSHVSVRLHHFGDPFDPSAAPSLPLHGSRESGYGAYIITRCVDSVRYYRDERGRNCVALTKLRAPQSV
jgi:sigma-B regulation protein RsbU (phosphoserine phosphatase)